LPSLNGPDVCKNCLNNQLEFQTSPTTFPAWQPKIKKVKKITRTIDKYDAEGKLIGREVITEEVENIEKEVWEQSGTITIGHSPTDVMPGVTQYNPDIPFTLTSCINDNFSAITNNSIKN